LPTCLALALVSLAIGGCRTQKAGQYSVDERPIIIAHNSDGSIHFTCLNREECVPLGIP
jgi:hypothetical protein